MSPAKSVKQFKFFKAVEAGKVPGVPKKLGREFTEGVKPSKLPEKVKPKQ